MGWLEKRLNERLALIDCDVCKYQEECNQNCEHCRWEQEEYNDYEVACDTECDRLMGK